MWISFHNPLKVKLLAGDLPVGFPSNTPKRYSAQIPLPNPQDLDDTEDKQLNIKNTEACFMDARW